MYNFSAAYFYVSRMASLLVANKWLNIEFQVCGAQLLTSVLSLSTPQGKCQWPTNMKTHTNGNHRETVFRYEFWSYSEPPCVHPLGVFGWYEIRAQMPAYKLRQELIFSTSGPPAAWERSEVHHWLNVTRPLKAWLDYETRQPEWKGHKKMLCRRCASLFCASLLWLFVVAVHLMLWFCVFL